MRHGYFDSEFDLANVLPEGIVKNDTKKCTWFNEYDWGTLSCN